jgi:hypothetical protein
MDVVLSLNKQLSMEKSDQPYTPTSLSMNWQLDNSTELFTVTAWKHRLKTQLVYCWEAKGVS